MKPVQNPLAEATMHARLYLQRALIGEVSPALRAVVFSITDLTLDVRFYFDRQISEEDEESVSLVETEVIADYPPEITVTAHCVRLDYPFPINDYGTWVYKRREKLSED